MEARERLLKHHNLQMQQKAQRPVSNQIDRFGRIAFNRNRELSRASLDVRSNDSDKNQQEEEKKEMMGAANHLIHNQRNMRTDQEDVLFGALKKRRQRQRNEIQGVNVERDPMELEFNQQSVIMRLNRMKNVHAQGKVINQEELNKNLGKSFDLSK